MGVTVYFITTTRACLKKAFCKMCVTICGRFRPDESVVTGYDNRIRMKYTAKWGVQIAGMIFQTGSNFALYRNMFYMNVLLSETKLPEKITFCIIALGSINCFYIAVEHVTKFINLISKHTIYKGHIILHQFLD